MIRTEADGKTIDNKYTEGNAALGIPATVVGAPELNSIQEELAKTVERYGLTLKTRATDTQDQIYTAMEIMHRLGGRPAPVTMPIANNQATPADVTGFPELDSDTIRAVEFLYTMTRKTDTAQMLETGRGFLTYNPTTNAWVSSFISVHDGAGVTFSTAVVSGTSSKLQYSSDDLAGTSYTSAMTITDIKELRV